MTTTTTRTMIATVCYWNINPETLIVSCEVGPIYGSVQVFRDHLDNLDGSLLLALLKSNDLNGDYDHLSDRDLYSAVLVAFDLI